VKPVDFDPDAAAEARVAATRYESIRPNLGEDFRTELAAALARIRANPQMYAVESGAIRMAPLARFPYSLI